MDFEVYPNVAKAEDAADPRRQGQSRTKVLRAHANKGDVAPYGFPEGLKTGRFLSKSGLHF
jgi:hypothetical protein